MTGPKRIVFMILAGLFFVLGALGAVLPVLPTTPFLLLTSYFLARSSPRLNSWLLASRFFGPILKDWQQLGGVRPDVKVKAIMIVLLAVSLSLWLTDLSSTLRWIVATIALIGIGVILRLPTPDSAEPTEKS
ncbi:MAG: YbaN family protein [Planctomycetales bacterium]